MSDPRIWARRVSVARQLGRSRRRKLVALLLAVGLAAGAFALVHSSVFGARQVRVSGAPQVSRSAVIEAAGLAGRPPLIDLDAGVIARRVERLPWVASAAVQIAWPSTVSIRLTERVPVAAVRRSAGGFALCDPTGRVLEDVAVRPGSLPMIAGTAPPPPGSRLDRRGRALAAVAATMPESLVPRTFELADSPDGIVVVLAARLQAIVGSSKDLGQKFVSLATVLERADLTGVTVIDLRVAAAPVLIRQTRGPIVAANVGG